MGAKDWMLFYATGEIRPILRAAPPIDRDATTALVRRLYPRRRVDPIEDGCLARDTNPADFHVYAGVFSGLTVVCTGDAGLDRPSTLDRSFRDEARGRRLYLHAMHSVSDWFAYAVWAGDGRLERALSLSPGSGVIENIGRPYDFERAYWAGEHPVDWLDDDDDPYPLPFHPLQLAEDALRALFGFNLDGPHHDDDPELERVGLAGFTVHPVRPAGAAGRIDPWRRQ